MKQRFCERFTGVPTRRMLETLFSWLKIVIDYLYCESELVTEADFVEGSSWSDDYMVQMGGCETGLHWKGASATEQAQNWSGMD